MSSNYSPVTLVASGTISPARFVKISGAFTGAQAGANEVTFGISDVGTRAPTTTNPNEHAIATEHIYVHPIGAEAMLAIGGTVAAGGRLKSDSNGKGVAIATTGTTIQQIGAIALEGGADGDTIRVKIVSSSERPALS